jgi:NitT/TauT family transport system substrate-binding protein
MPSNPAGKRKWRLTLARRYGLLAAAWLIVITLLHCSLNMHRQDRDLVRMGYMPVVTNLAAPLLDFVSRDAGPYRFEAIKFASFAEMAESLRNGHIDAAFMIAPLAIVLRQQNENVRIVYIGNRHESTLVARKDLSIRDIGGLAGHTLAVPMRYSGHHLGILRAQEERGMGKSINIVEMNPPDMASALSAGVLDAYFVGEPFAAQTILSGDAQVVNYVEDLWPQFICNLVIVKQAFIDTRPKAVQQLVQTAMRSGLWAEQHPDQDADIAARYWNQTPELIRYALTTPRARIDYQRSVPQASEIQLMADLMVRYKLIAHNDTSGLVEDRFAREADLKGVSDVGSILR